MQAHPTRATNQWWLVVCAGLAIFMAQLDTTAVNVALPTMRDDLHVSAGAIEWVVLSYLVPLIAMSLLCGRWLDESGLRTAATVTTIGFAASSVAVAVAPEIVTVVAARAAQGAFASGLLALAPVLAVEAVRDDSRGRALGIVSTLAPLGAMAGPSLGGQLIDLASWRVIFVMNVPVALAVVVPARRGLDDARPLRRPRPAWLAEAALLAVAAVVALSSLSLAASHGLPWLLVMLASAAPLMFWCQSAISRPVRSLINKPGLRSPHLSLLTSYTGLLAAQFLVPFYMHSSLRSSAGVIGVTLLAYPAGAALMGPVSGAWSDRSGRQVVAVAGAVVLMTGLALLAPLATGWSAVDVAWRLAVLGVGFGLFVTPAQKLAMERAGKPRVGLVSATTNLARQSGLALGPALATLAWGLDGYRADGMRIGLIIAAAIGGVTVAATSFATHAPRRRNPASIPLRLSSSQHSGRSTTR